ncbi:hypothetical protein M409DRAFT_66487 [Zasmidium cellare ATCC 36951]|uniref:Uncharacterized protein n=1 Tax=Zasmidium cellare ATCC 36951 TaxID=1080233 RepID=A0A6A6CL99_ZASCE|nr:uncharacterized protein M409DRAFT_66487 [Zasmidium cellare ATCC 36951]KAF2166978.1 hypothetical protein M409DRAFT_66487 [Zasmidium cellare ATCC 36951]
MATQTTTTKSIFAGSAGTNIQSAPLRTTPQPRIRGYKDFLTPALHRRFTQAAGSVLLLCLVDSTLLSTSSSYLWRWFPFGPAGIRALLLFIPCLAVFIVRVASMHIGKRTANSRAETIYAQLFSGRALHTLIWYIFSAWWFGEVYIWNSRDSAALMMVDPGRPYERPELNENPIFIRSSFLVLGVLRCGWHLLADYDRVAIPTGKEEEEPKPNFITSTLGIQPATIAWLPRPFGALLERIGIMANTCGQTVAIGWLANMILYFLVFRYPAWRWTYSFVSPFFSQMQPSTRPRGFTHAPTVVWQSVSSAFMLCILWEYSNTVFDSFVTQAPTKKGEPLTSEIKDARGVILHKSADPNGSLLNGLNAKKEVNKAFALWELYLICTRYDKRRKTIYTEVDRKDGSTWSKVCEYTLKEATSIRDRIKAATDPGEYKSKQAELAAQNEQKKDLIPVERQHLGLRKIADQGVQNDADVFVKRKGDFVHQVGELAKSVGQSPGSDPAKMAWDWSKKNVLTQDQLKHLQETPEQIRQASNGYLSNMLRTPAGEPFRLTFARRASVVILGTPTSGKTNVIHAIKSLSRLAVCSLKEDDYGSVQRDVARIIRTLTETIQLIENFVGTVEPHWTDVSYFEKERYAQVKRLQAEACEREAKTKEREHRRAEADALKNDAVTLKRQAASLLVSRRNIGEAQEVLDALKGSLEEIMLAFAEYAGTLGLSKKEVREARELFWRGAGGLEKGIGWG